VWRIGGWARPVIPALTGICAVASVIRWIHWLLSPSGPAAVQPAIIAVTALVLGVLTRWVVLRPSLEFGPDLIVITNPLATYRLPYGQVTAVRLGTWGAEFHSAEGFHFTAYALSEGASGVPQNQRFAEVRTAFEARGHPSPR
jgi:hypothetical protein